jgi:hypothetical protein
VDAFRAAVLSSGSPSHALQFSRFLVDRLIDKSIVPASLGDPQGTVTAALTTLLATGDTGYSSDIVLVLQSSVDESLYDMNAVHDAAAANGFWRVCGAMNSSVGDVRSVVVYHLKDSDAAYVRAKRARGRRSSTAEAGKGAVCREETPRTTNSPRYRARLHMGIRASPTNSPTNSSFLLASLALVLPARSARTLSSCLLPPH